MSIKLQSISASERWLQCTKSLEYNQGFTANAVANYGSLIHEVASLRLDEIFNKTNNKEKIKQLKQEPYINKNDYNIVSNWDRKAEKICDEYINFAIRLYNQYKPYKVLLEQKVNVLWYGYEKIGIIDLIMFFDKGVVICDLKTGYSKVDVEYNSQMLMYLLGVMQNFPDLIENNFLGVIAICQPPINNIATQDIAQNDLWEFYASKNEKMQEIITGNLQYAPSSKACKYCDYKEFCNARISAGVF